MSQQKRKPVLIIGDHPKIRDRHQVLEEEFIRFRERQRFLQDKLDELSKEAAESQKSFWNDVEEILLAEERINKEEAGRLAGDDGVIFVNPPPIPSPFAFRR